MERLEKLTTPSIGEREVGEGLEACVKNNFEEYNYKCKNETEVESLLRETISQLETALRESTKLLSQRDNEIVSLRSDLGLCRGERGNNASDTLEEEFKNSQKRVLDLEKVVQQLQQDITMYKAERENILAKDNLNEANVAGQTCYCGSLCGAMKEMVELKKKLHVTEQKYSNLKRAFKTLERSKVRVGVAHRDSPCTIS